MRILFVDDRPEEIELLWERSGIGSHERQTVSGASSPFEAFWKFRPNVLVAGSEGVTFVKDVRKSGRRVSVLLNSGGGRQAFGAEIASEGYISIDRSPRKLAEAIGYLRSSEGQIAEARHWREVALASASVSVRGGEEPWLVAEAHVEKALEEGDSGALAVALAEFVATDSASAEVEPGWPVHCGWVHSLSHFTEKLWQIGELGWLQRLYRLAVENAVGVAAGEIVLDEYARPFGCIDRLLRNFAEQAAWDEDPGEYGLNQEVVGSSMKTDDSEFNWISERMALGRFATEADWGRWYVGETEEKG